MRQPSANILAATQNDSLLHIIDCRSGSIVCDLKVCIGKSLKNYILQDLQFDKKYLILGSAGLIRCLAAEPDENTISVGHSSGFISQLGKEKLSKVEKKSF